MLARALPGVPVLVCPDRHLAGRMAVERFQTTVALLDDGFQHLRLSRDIDLLLVAPGDLDERPLPSGRLREPLSAARAADALLVPGLLEDAARVGAALGVETVFRIEHHYQPPRLVHPFGGTLPARPASACPQCAVAVAAIARPDRFFAAAVDEGWNVRREISYRDHHWFTLRDVEKIVAQAHDVAAEVVLTTEKDAVRFEALMPATGPMWAYLPMSVSIEPADAFREWLADRIRAARARMP
jgi:tetraacyldisaccharide 4'-kinase